jgi:hypothetical protein
VGLCVAAAVGCGASVHSALCLYTANGVAAERRKKATNIYAIDLTTMISLHRYLVVKSIAQCL